MDEQSGESNEEDVMGDGIVTVTVIVTEVLAFKITDT